MSPRRVVVTGIGLVGPTGVGLDAFWSHLAAGRSAIGRVTRFDAAGFPCVAAGEVRDESWAVRLGARRNRTTAHVVRLAVAAGLLALDDAGTATPFVDPSRAGVALGTAVGGWRDAEEQVIAMVERGLRRVNPFLANGSPPFAPGGELAGAIHAEGPQVTVSNGCPSGLEAIARGAELVAAGELDVCLAGGSESPILRCVYAGMGRTHELAPSADDESRASRPFDVGHAGLVPSEGAVVLVLEPLESAERRGARLHGEVLGFAASCDARGLYGLDPDGEVAARTIGAALARAGRVPDEVDWVCAHANGAPAFDRKEARVLRRAFGSHVERLPVSSIKGVLGHPFGAAGAFQVAATTLAMRHAAIPPTAHLETPDPECELAHVAGASRTAALRTVVVTSYGYGGVNACLVVGAPPA